MGPISSDYTNVEWLDGSRLTSIDFRNAGISKPRFQGYHKDALRVFGSRPQLRRALQSPLSLFHEAAVFIPGSEQDKLFVTSNILQDEDGSRQIRISKLVRTGGEQSWCHEEVLAPAIPMANGAVNMHDGRVLFCSQGTKTDPSSLVAMNVTEPYETTRVLTNFHDRAFNSLNDVVIARDGAIWFTDPIYGHEQGFRPKPELPCQVYRFDPATHSVRAVADGFGRPNGLCFSPDEETLYVTDTDWIHGDGSVDGSRASHIYAFTVSRLNDGIYLTNRRLFAMADCGAPDGIKCDTEGRVYSGCGDGLNIWSANGQLIAKILVPGGVANFCFGRPGEILLLNETMFWVAEVASDIRGALLDGMGVAV